MLNKGLRIGAIMERNHVKRVILAAVVAALSFVGFAEVVEPAEYVNLVQTTPGKYVCGVTSEWYDGNLGTRWYSGYTVPNPETGVTVDSCITFGTNRIVVNAYRFYTFEGSAAKRSPKHWRFYGRRCPGDDWILLDERTDEQGLQKGVWKLYSFDNEIACSAFKFVVTEKPTKDDLFSLYEVAFHYVERSDELAVCGNAPMIDGVGHYDLASGDTVRIEAPASPAANPATGDRYTLQGFRIVDFAGNEIVTGTPDDLPYTYTHEGEYRRFEWIWEGQYEALAETLNVDITEPSKSGVNIIENITPVNSGAENLFDNKTGSRFLWQSAPSVENPCWFSYQFLTGARTVSAFTIRQTNDKRYFSDFELQGSNDGESWATLHRVTDACVDDSIVDRQIYRFQNNAPYDRYRFLVTKTKDNGTNVEAYEVELFEHALTDALRITGYPQSVGVPAPFYGYETDLADGQEITCTAPTESIQIGDETLVAVGYQLRVGGELGAVVNETTCTYRHRAGTAAELQWIFGVKTSQRIEVKGNGTVEPATFSAEDGEEVTVTATPGADSFFAYWEGDVPEEMKYSPVLKFTVQGKMNITAVFGSAYYVKPDGNDANDGLSRATAFATVTNALAVAANADKVFVASGTYEMPDATIEINDPIMLVGEDGPETTILQATGEKHRHFYVNNVKFLMSGFTLTDGSAADDSGGAMRLVAGTVTNCIFRGNKSTTGRGGAVLLASENALLTDSVITNNSSSGSGGGVCIVVGGRVERCLFEDNTASYGGGIAGSAGCVGEVRGCTIRNCKATSNGGGAYQVKTLSDSVIEGCTASARGGGLADVSVISHCTVTGCEGRGGSGDYLGGGGAYSETFPMTFDNTLFTDNTSPYGGGAIGSKQQVVIRNVTIAGNKGPSPAVALYSTARLSAVNSVVAYNSDKNDVTNGPSCRGSGGPAFSVLDHSCVFDDSYTNVTATATVVGSIQKDPLFNLEMRKSRPYWSLRGTSPCKDAGARLDYTADDVDLEGRPRVIGSRPDMGCYECALGGMAIIVR